MSHQSITARTQVLFRASACDIYGEQSGSGTSYSPSTLVLPSSTIQQMVHTHLHSHIALFKRMNGRSLGNISHYSPPKKAVFLLIGGQWLENCSHFFNSGQIRLLVTQCFSTIKTVPAPRHKNPVFSPTGGSTPRQTH